MREFKVGEKEYGIVSPSKKIQDDAQKMYMKIFYASLKNGNILEGAMDNFLKEHGIWDNKKEAQIVSLREISDLEKIFEEGGVPLKEAETIAYSVREKRVELLNLTSYKKQYTDVTVENQAEDAKFNYILSQCLVDKEGEKVFASYDEFMASEDMDLGNRAALELTKIMYGDIIEIYKETPENKFLLDYGFVDDRLQKKQDENSFKPFLDESGKEIEKEIAAK